MYASRDEVPCIINGEEIYTGNVETQVMPTEHGHVVCDYHTADESTVQKAIDAAMSPAAREWAKWPFEDRAAVFLKVADLCAGKYREKMNASIMLGTGKTPREADIDNTEVRFFRYRKKYVFTTLTRSIFRSPISSGLPSRMQLPFTACSLRPCILRKTTGIVWSIVPWTALCLPLHHSTFVLSARIFLAYPQSSETQYSSNPL